MVQINNTNGERGHLSPFLWISLALGAVLSFGLANGDAYEGILQTGGLAAIRTGSFAEKSFLVHVLCSRLGYMVVLILFSTTSWRKLLLTLQPILLCLGIGAWAGVAISEFGVKGIVLVLVGMFPHMFLYFLILRFLLRVLWERIYYDRQFFIAIFILSFLIIMGCLLESYVNPWIVGKILYLF